MTREIKHNIREKSKIYKKYVNNKFDLGYKEILNVLKIKTSDLIASAKESYYKKEGKKLLDPTLGPKQYWAILNSFLGNKKNADDLTPV